MRLIAWLGVVSMAACNAKKTAPTDRSSPTTPDVTDPWSASAGPGDAAGSNEPVPAWASDPPNVLRDKINGVNAHVIVLKVITEFPEYGDVLTVVERAAGVVNAEPFIFLEGYISSASKGPLPLALKAVDPARVDRVLTVGNHLRSGAMALAKGKPAPIVLGDGLAQTLAVTVGDDVTVTPSAEFADAASKPGVFRVAGTFHMAFDEYDDKLALTSIAPVQAMLGRGDQVMGIEATVADLDKSGEVAQAIEDTLGGPPYRVMDWYELNKALFIALYGTRRP